MMEVILAIVILDMNHLVHQLHVIILTNVTIVRVVKVLVLTLMVVTHAHATLDTQLVQHHLSHAQI